MRNFEKEMKPEHTARHEAGHCLIVYLLGGQLGACAIEDDGPNSGYVDLPEPSDASMVKEVGQTITINSRGITPTGEMYVAVAGGVAGRHYEGDYPARCSEDLYTKKILGRDCENDLKQAKEALMQKGCGDCETYLFLARICERVHVCIEQHWEAIEAIAKALLGARVLSGSRIDEMLSKQIARPPVGKSGGNEAGDVCEKK